MDDLPSEQKVRKLNKFEKREKQRQLNPIRAQKMHVERISNPILKTTASKTSRFELNVGCSGWFYWGWRDRFYPLHSNPNEWFSYYTKVFKTVELNAPFYSWPTVNTVKNWVKQAGRKKFIYTVKVCELITHLKKFSGTSELIKDFDYIADLLQDKMGCFLFQLPPSFNYTPARLKNILKQLPPNRKNVVEFRHQSWWNEEVYAAFQEANAIFCSISSPKLPDVLIKTSDSIYIRFHGKEKWYKHDYTKEELQEWIERIIASKAKDVWVYFNNDYNAYAVKNAKLFLKEFKKKCKTS